MVKSCTIWNDNQYTDNYRLGFDFEDDKKPDKIVLSNRDDDRGYDNPVRWEFEIVDKKYIDDADAALQAQITTNAQNIQQNANNISRNADNITTNTTQLADHEARITNNSNSIITINNTLANLPNHMHIFDKVYIDNAGLDYYRFHTYIVNMTDTQLKVAVEMDFRTEKDILTKPSLSFILPWVVFDPITATYAASAVYGKTVQINQTPLLSDVFAIIYDSGAGTTVKDSNLVFFQTNNTQTEYAKMNLYYQQTSIKSDPRSGRIFCTLTFILL